jgi:hypothetical protein
LSIQALTISADFDALDLTATGQQTLYLVLAVLALLIALRFMKRALAPIEVFVQAITAAAIMAFAIAVAIALVLAAALRAH